MRLKTAASLTFVIVAWAANWTGADPVRVATYNVRNYLAMDRRVDERFRPAYPKPEDEKTALRAVIRAADADVLCLQEMGAADYLEELRQDLEREGLGYSFAHVLEAADPYRHLAVLSRVPIAAVRDHAGLAFEYFGEPAVAKRGMLEVELDAKAGRWSIFVVHLKSRWSDRKDDPDSHLRRLGEAGAIVSLIRERFADPASGRFAIVGDFNDGPESPTLALFTAPRRSLRMHAVPAADSRGETWTLRFDAADRYERTDFILVSSALRPWVVGGKGAIIDIEGARLASDHRLVVATFDPDLATAQNETPP